MDAVRHTSVAGTWYPDDPRRLVAEVERFVAEADVEPLPQQPRALVVPHAGLTYSGPVAAFAYKIARDLPYRALILVGPSHFVPFRGVSLWPAGRWETPLGPVPVDDELAAAIRAQSEEIVEMSAAHAREHSLEMQLPFVAHLLPHPAIVPLVMGYQTRATAFALGDAIAAAVAARTSPHTRGQPVGTGPIGARDRQSAGPGPGEVLLVASSDLSHYHDAGTAADLDATVITHVEALDADGLMGALEREPGHACGGGPMVAVLHAARQLGATASRVLRYADSGDVSGDKSSVVGYMAAAVW